MERDANVAPSAQGACPDEQVILDLALGALPPEARRLTWEHVEQCQDCARLVGAALPFLGPDTPSPAAWQVAWERHGQAAKLGAASSAGGSADDTVPGPHTSDLPVRSLRPGQELRNRYRIVRYLGRGAMGEVYEARHARLVGRYAVKILNVDLTQNQTALQRFRREAAIASELRHPNIVQVIDFDETDDGRPYLVMELLEGRDLGALIAGGPIPVERALALSRQIAAGLSAMHGLGIIHRDLKPANVLVLPAGPSEPERVKLVDFGLSRRLVPSLAVTHDRMLLGTPQYMAPEQAQGSAEGVGPAADQFAMAAIVYEMLAGRPTFDGELLSVVLYRIVYEPPPPLTDLVPGLSPQIQSAIARALAKAPGQRFPSVGEFQAALDADQRRGLTALSFETVAVEAQPTPARAGRRAVKWLGVSSGVAVAGLALRWFLPHAPPGPLAPPPIVSGDGRPALSKTAPATWKSAPEITATPPGLKTLATQRSEPPTVKAPGNRLRAPKRLAPHGAGDPPPPMNLGPATTAANPGPTTAAPPGEGDVEPAGPAPSSATSMNSTADAGIQKGRPLVPHL